MKFPANKILIIVTRQIGDVLLTTPLLRSLRHAYPHALLDVLLYEGTESILNGNPDVNALITVSEHPALKESIRLARKIFRRYDLAISTLCGDRPIVYTLQAASKRVSIVPPYRLVDTWKRVISHGWTELDNWDTHTLIQNLRLCDVLGIDRSYEVVVPESPDSEERLNQMLPFPLQEQAYAVFHMVPLRRYKQWTLTGWTRLAQYLTSEGLSVVVTGGGDREETDYIRSAMSDMPKGIVNLAGGLTFPEVARLLRMSKVYIGPDTAVTHLAAATGTPTVALYGPTNPVKWAPWPHGYAQDKNPFERKGTQLVGNVLLIQGPGDCVPCHLEGCERHRQSKSLCLEELSAETVIHGVRNILNASPQ
jgi:heptosyltransferase-3